MLLGATSGRSYVEIDEISLRVRFGWLFDYTFPISDVESARCSNWPLYFGLGWRTTLGGRIGLIGSLKGVVEVRLGDGHRVNMVIPRLRCNRLFISLEEPEGFTSVLEEAKR